MSSPNVVRSLSADELSSSLTRTDHLPFSTAADPLRAHVLNPDHKQKRGLLKRLRRVFRLSTHDLPSSQNDKRSRKHAQNQCSEKSHSSFLSDSASIPKKHTARSKTWRDSLPLRHTSEYGATEGSHTNRSSVGIGLSRSKESMNGDTAHATENIIPTSSVHSTFSARNLHRSLPKRVFSSPPSFSARTFGFGGRKRNGGSSKSSQSRSTTLNNGLAEENVNGITRLNRSLAVRTSLYESRGSLSLATVPPTGDIRASTPERSAAAFREVIEGATEGRVPFTNLLDAMYRLEERLVADVKDMLIKYLSRQESIEALIDKLIAIAPFHLAEDQTDKPIAQLERYRYSYVSCTLLSTGPIQLRKSLFLNPRHLDRLVSILGRNVPSDPVVVRSVCRVLLSVLRDSPEETVRAIVKRADFVDVLLSHIAVTGCPEVCLSMLSTVRCQAELKFGPCNKPVVGMMADSRLMEALCNKLADATENGPLNSSSSSVIENCSRVIVGIALRVLVIPKYEVNNEDSDVSYMLKFNRDLESLDIFLEPRPILRLLDSGITAMHAHDSRGYALSTALTAVRYLLVTALKGRDSSLSTIRMQLTTVNIEGYEAGVRARLPKLARILEDARDGAVVETMWERVQNPLGVVRLKILELVVVLLQHGTEATAMAIAKAEIPRILVNLFVRLKRNSLLQHFVSAIIELVFAGPFPYLRRSFLIELRIVDPLISFWNDGSGCGNMTNPVRSDCAGELLRIVCAIQEFLKINEKEAREYRKELGAHTMERFDLFCKGPVAEKLRENGTLLCEPGDLPHRPIDDLSMDAYNSIGSQGQLFLRPNDKSTAER